MTDTNFMVMWEAMSQFVSNHANFVESLDPGEEHDKEAAKLAAAEKILAEMDAKMCALAD